MNLESTALVQLVLGLILAAVVSFAAFRFKLVTGNGAWSALVLGWLTFGSGGLRWAAVLLTFFISSSLLSKVLKKQKAEAESKYAKGSRRDLGQVLANGGVAGLFALLHFFFPFSPLPWIGFCASLAAANADTWATELGVLNRKQPVLITNGRPVEAGTSGAISLAGTLAAAAGALAVGLVSTLLAPAGTQPLSNAALAIVVFAAGLIGSLVDSFLGATVQAIYVCSNCGRNTEKHPIHTCGGQTSRVKGWRWLNNDWVNFGCTFSAVLVAFLLNYFFI